MGSACSSNTNVVEPLPVIKEEEKEGITYRVNPVPVVGVRGVRQLRERGSDYWGKKYVGDEA